MKDSAEAFADFILKGICHKRCGKSKTCLLTVLDSFVCMHGVESNMKEGDCQPAELGRHLQGRKLS